MFPALCRLLNEDRIETGFHSSAAGISCLLWRTFYCTITAINTTVALFWFQNNLTIFTLIKKAAGISGHGFFFLMTATRTGDD